jgi:D-xylose transport system substrate-binding protein
MKLRTKWLGLFLAFGLVLAACGSDAEPDTTDAASPDATEAGGDDGLVIGVSWNNYQEERWAKWDEPAIKAAVEAAGGTYISTDAGSSAEQQISDVEDLITQGADALIILAQDGVAILPAVASALEQGIPVVAYDRLIEDSGAYYITFDNVEVGRMQARAVLAAVPEGRYVFIKGDPGDANAEFLFGGQLEVLSEAAGCDVPAEPDETADCTILNVATQSTDAWQPELAQTNMEQILTELGNDLDAVVSSNDGMAGGVVAALEAQGLDGVIPVSGQDGDQAALNRVALGTQIVSVWKDARVLGQAAGEAAVAMAQGTAMADIPGTIQFDTPGGNTMNTILLSPLPISVDNLDLVVTAGWIDLDTLCQGVEAGTVDICG